MALVSTYIPMIALNISGLNYPTKRNKVAELIEKQDPTIYCL